MKRAIAATVMAGVLCAAGVRGDVVGWRGDWTGRYPDADPPTSWYVRPKSPVYGLKCQAEKPKTGDTGESAKIVWAGDVNDWLILGPFTAKDPASQGSAVASPASGLDEPLLANESDVEPAQGDKAGEYEWKRYTLPHYQETVRDPKEHEKHKYDPYKVGGLESGVQFGVRWLNLPGKGKDQVTYAHTYLYAQTNGTICVVLNHGDGLRAWVNGKEVYKKAGPGINFGAYEPDHSIDRLEVPEPAPRFNAELKKGWNRLLLKVKRSGGIHIAVSITAPADAEYETKNVVWATKMPDWSWSSPIVVKDKVFVNSEPDELVCVDKNTGKILWRRVSTIFDTVIEEERAKNPLFREIEPLAAELAKGADKDTGTVLRRKMFDLLNKIDKEKYWRSVVIHSPAIGFSCATPVSDGECVYAQYFPGVVVCYDLNGNRRWIQNIMDLGYSFWKEGNRSLHFGGTSSPVIIGDKLIVLKGWYRAFDKKTGKVVWDSGPINTDLWASEGNVPNLGSTTSCVPGRVGNIDFVIGFQGIGMVRASDGKIMSKPVREPPQDHYGTPCIEGDTVYEWGIAKWKLSVDGDAIKKEKVGMVQPAGDFSFSSPLVHDGLTYSLSSVAVLQVADAESGEIVYRQPLEMTPLYHYNAIGCTPSVCLAGENIYLMDNQGTCVVVKPGKTFSLVSINRIDTMMQHVWPLSPQERFEATPTFSGKYTYIRGERNLYCIGEK